MTRLSLALTGIVVAGLLACVMLAVSSFHVRDSRTLENTEPLYLEPVPDSPQPD